MRIARMTAAAAAKATRRPMPTWQRHLDCHSLGPGGRGGGTPGWAGGSEAWFGRAWGGWSWFQSMLLVWSNKKQLFGPRSKKGMLLPKTAETTAGLPPQQIAYLVAGAFPALSELNLMELGGNALSTAAALAEQAKKLGGSEAEKFQASLRAARSKQIASDKWSAILKKILATGALNKRVGLGRVLRGKRHLEGS